MKYFNALLFCFIFLGSCSSENQHVRVAERETQDPVSDFEFVSELSKKESPTVEDMVRLFSISLETAVSEEDGFNSLLWMKACSQSGWLSDGVKAQDKLTYAHVGRFLAGRCHLQGNLFLHMFGPSEKYGLRECQHLGFLDRSFPNQHIPGSVLMTACSMADAFVERYENNQAKAFKEYLNSFTNFLKSLNTELKKESESNK